MHEKRVVTPLEELLSICAALAYFQVLDGNVEYFPFVVS